MWFKPKWCDGVPEELGLNTDSYIKLLESIRKRHNIDHDTFRGMICRCGATRRRIYLQMDGATKYRAQIFDERKRWKGLAIFCLVSAQRRLQSGEQTTLSQANIDVLTESLSDTADAFRNVDDAIDYCMEVDRRQDLIVASIGPVVEVEVVIRRVVEERALRMLDQIPHVLNELKKRRHG